MTPIRIILADDHTVLRTGLAALLNARSDMTVIGEAADGVELLALVETEQPDIILLDLTMPRLGGLEALPLLRQRVPDARILILTMHHDEGYLRRAFKSGASGYVLKKAADVELIVAIQAVMRGDVYVHPSMTRALLEDATPDNEKPAAEEELWNTLSEREQEVLRLVALGHTSKEIADQLALSVKTVDTYRARGMEKLELRSRAALVRFALAQGLLE
ncbi:MAG TPA: response regulator transcription factor [Chloroflexota bacterium]|nr:response regulator transcription factor [Chloroflexota bacterium]